METICKDCKNRGCMFDAKIECQCPCHFAQESLYPNPQIIHKAELAELTFKTFLTMQNELDRLTKRVKKLEDEV